MRTVDRHGAQGVRHIEAGLTLLSGLDLQPGEFFPRFPSALEKEPAALAIDFQPGNGVTVAWMPVDRNDSQAHTLDSQRIVSLTRKW